MAIADSYVDYSAEIIRISNQNRSMTVRFTSVDSADGRDPVFRNISLGSGVINDSSVQNLIKAAGQGIANQWSDQLVSEAANPSFNDSDFIGDTYSFRYKPRAQDSYPAVNNTLFTVEAYDSEGDFEIRTKYNVVARDSSEVETIQTGINGATTISKSDLLIKLRDEGNLDSALDLFDARLIYHASWDASAGAAFDFSTDGITSAGVDTVERVAEGIYRVVFTKTQANTNYTVATGVGDQISASPLQLTVISRAVDSMQLNCERTDDSAQEDNGYMSFIMTPSLTLTDSSLQWAHSGGFSFNGRVMNAIQDLKGYNDSDMLVWMRDV